MANTTINTSQLPLSDKVTISTNIYGMKYGRLCILVFSGPYYGLTVPDNFRPLSVVKGEQFHQRQVLLAGEGSERWLAHMEGACNTLSNSIGVYIHKNGGEALIPSDGSYNIYGTAMYLGEN